MAKYVLIGIEDEMRMLVVDCEAMTVGEINPSAGGVPAGEADKLQAINGARAAGLTLFKGVNVAIVTTQRSEAASFPYVASFPYSESA
jgi:hypothetical protein